MLEVYTNNLYICSYVLYLQSYVFNFLCLYLVIAMKKICLKHFYTYTQTCMLANTI
ncbi:hypothetical protein Hanom_Chr09g00792201 [Helianthus anomalus]